MNRLPVRRHVLAAAALSFAAASAARGDVIGNWDFSTGSLAPLAGQIALAELRTKPYYAAFGGQPGIPAVAFGSPASFGITGPGGTSKTVLRVPNTAGFGPMGGLIAEFPRRVNATENSLNRYTIVMDVLVRQAAYDEIFARGTKQYASLFQTVPLSDGDLFIDVRDQAGLPGADRPLGVGGVYGGDVTAEQWHRIAWVASLDASTSQPRFTAYVNGQPAGTLIWDELAVGRDFDSVKRDLTDPDAPAGALQTDGRFSILNLEQISGGQITDSGTSALFLFNDNDNELGEVFVAHLQFRAEALSPAEILALGGVDGGPIAVPEPAALVLAALGGLLAIGARAYRSKSITTAAGPASVA